MGHRFVDKGIFMIIYPILAIIGALNFAPQEQIRKVPKMLETPIEVSGKWLPALEVAISSFNALKKESLKCYEISIFEENNLLIVKFYAKPNDYKIDVRGSQSSCGRSVEYYLNVDAKIVKIDYFL